MTPQTLQERVIRSNAASGRSFEARHQPSVLPGIWQERVSRGASSRRLTARHTMFWGLMLSVVMLTGCTKSPRDSIARLWDHVPSTPWAAGKSNERKVQEEKPTVAANSAATLSARDSMAADTVAEDPFEVAIAPGQSATTDRAVETDRPSAESKNSPIHQTSMNSGSTSSDSAIVPTVDAPAVAKTTGAKLKEALPDPLSASPGDWAKAFELANGLDKAKETAAEDVSRLGQLRVTLEEDAQAVTKRSIAELNEFRLRIESLLSHARRQIEAGELKTAQRFARLANELSEGAGLEYSPTEERPQELLHRIEDLIALSRPEAGELNPGEVGEPSKSMVAEPESIIIAADGPTAASVEMSSSDGHLMKLAEDSPALQGSVSANRALGSVRQAIPADSIEEDVRVSDAVVTAHVVKREAEESTVPPLYLPGVDQLGTEIRTRGESTPPQPATAMRTESLPETHNVDEKRLIHSKLNLDAIGEFEQLVLKSESAEAATSPGSRDQLMSWIPWVLGILLAVGAGWILARSTGRSIEVVVASTSHAAGGAQAADVTKITGQKTPSNHQ